tara:strand:+ start:139 stop:309 length:171 start_codon:yes stop_codon:yes gene_type:complete
MKQLGNREKTPNIMKLEVFDYLPSKVVDVTDEMKKFADTSNNFGSPLKLSELEEIN